MLPEILVNWRMEIVVGQGTAVDSTGRIVEPNQDVNLPEITEDVQATPNLPVKTDGKLVISAD